MDQCTNCEVKGNLSKCLKTDCSYHDLWMTKELHGEIQELRYLIQKANNYLSGGGCGGSSVQQMAQLWEGMEKGIPNDNRR